MTGTPSPNDTTEIGALSTQPWKMESHRFQPTLQTELAKELALQAATAAVIRMGVRARMSYREILHFLVAQFLVPSTEDTSHQIISPKKSPEGQIERILPVTSNPQYFVYREKPSQIR
jgi:hypothetical protein